MKTRNHLITILALALLSACGGGKTDDSSQSALQGACDPASGPAGTQVTCPAKDVADDCTFFFANQPTDFVFNAEEGSFSFTVPVAITGSQAMSFQCGDGEPFSAGTFVVSAPTADVSDAPSADGDVITPTDPGPGEPPAGEETAGGTTTGGTTGGEIETPPATETTTAATINSFTVTPVTGSSIRLMTYQVSYSYTNAKAAYIWGNMLNRTSGDTYVDASERCKLQDGRYLVTDQAGELIAGSENFEKWEYLSEGTLCDGSTECSSESTFTGLVMQEAKPTAKAVVQASPITQVTPITQPAAASNTDCRIDLNQADGSLVTSDSFYTRSYVQSGSLCLAVQGTNDAWTIQCVSGDQLNAPAVDFAIGTSVVISPRTDKMALDVSLKAVNATTVQVICTQDDEDIAARKIEVNEFTGEGSYSGSCEVDGETKSVVVSLYGVGDNNVVRKTYTLTMDEPTVKLKLSGTGPSTDATSKIDLQYSATRPFTVTDEAGTVVSSSDTYGEVAWLKERKFVGFKNVQEKDYLDGTKHDVTSPGQLEGTITNISVDHDYAEWTYKVFDFDGNMYEDSYSVPKNTFTTSSSLSKTDSGHENGDGSISCAVASDLTLWAEYDWTAQNVGVVDEATSDSNGKSIYVVSGDCELTGDQPDPSKYVAQSGKIRVTKHLGPKSGTYAAFGTCTVRFLYWDDSWSDKEITLEYQCN